MTTHDIEQYSLPIHSLVTVDSGFTECTELVVATIDILVEYFRML